MEETQEQKKERWHQLKRKMLGKKKQLVFNHTDLEKKISGTLGENGQSEGYEMQISVATECFRTNSCLKEKYSLANEKLRSGKVEKLACEYGSGICPISHLAPFPSK